MFSLHLGVMMTNGLSVRERLPGLAMLDKWTDSVNEYFLFAKEEEAPVWEQIGKIRVGEIRI